MGAVHDRINEALVQWIGRQHVVFVATAPLAPDGHVNVSPKGMTGTVAVLDDRTVAYLDLTGSGIETVAHLRENGGITLMWTAFEGPPRIVRIHGRGEVVLPEDDRWDDLTAGFSAHRGARAVVVVHAERVSDSCGYSVPLFDFREDRPRLTEWTNAQSDAELAAYRRQKNATSIDGLPGLAPTVDPLQR